MKFTRRKAGHEAGTMNCPVGETIRGPASLQMRNSFYWDECNKLLDRLEKVTH